MYLRGDAHAEKLKAAQDIEETYAQFGEKVRYINGVETHYMSRQTLMGMLAVANCKTRLFFEIEDANHEDC